MFEANVKCQETLNDCCTTDIFCLLNLFFVNFIVYIVKKKVYYIVDESLIRCATVGLFNYHFTFMYKMLSNGAGISSC